MDSLRLPSATAREEIRALMVLDQTEGMGLVGLRSLVRRFGSAADALRAPVSECRNACRSFTPPTQKEWRAADAALAAADGLGMSILTWADSRYPEALEHLHDPPPLLFLRGRAELLEEQAVTVVGARRATQRGRNVAGMIAASLARAGVSVVSGMALGIDGAAHRGALDAGGATVAVLGRGADEPYPRSHRRLFRDILDHGLVISEFGPGTPPLPHHFPRRNRILAALSQRVVVVEAGPRSGALITVEHALDLGVDVWAVPGPIDVATCEGSNRLLSEGARPLVTVSGFVEDVVGLPTGEAPPPPPGPGGRIVAELMDRPRGVDELAVTLDLSVPEILTLLTELEIRGLVRRMPGMRFGSPA